MSKIVLIGAGSVNFGLGTISDIFKSKSLENFNIVLYDIDSKSLDNTNRIANKYKEEANININITATTNRQEALKDANFCIISIEVGKRFDLWDQDWKIPLQYGIKQIYGENGGPGGLFHSLRIIPPIIDICSDIEKICPDAFIFNYSNPMQRICHCVTTKFPNLKFIGLCHEIASMERQLPILMNTNFSNIEIKAGGLNHLSILLEAKYKDSQKDGYPIIREKFDNYYANLINEHEGYPSKPGAERGVFKEIYKQYGFLPITTDSHLGEYIQWAHSVADHDAILDFYKNYRKRCLEFYGTEKNYSNFFNEKSNHMQERVVPIIEAILDNSDMEEHAINIPNNNFIDSIDNGIVVEVPGLVNKNGLNGIKLSNYPVDFGSLLNNQSGTIRLTTEAVLKKSKQSAYLALLSDPLVDNAKSASNLLDTMLELQKDYIGYLN